MVRRATDLECDKRETLLRETVALLQRDERSVTEISVGTGIPQTWLDRMKKDKVKGPSVNRVQLLYEFLTGKKLIKPLSASQLPAEEERMPDGFVDVKRKRAKFEWVE